MYGGIRGTPCWTAAYEAAQRGYQLAEQEDADVPTSTWSYSGPTRWDTIKRTHSSYFEPNPPDALLRAQQARRPTRPLGMSREAILRVPATTRRRNRTFQAEVDPGPAGFEVSHLLGF